MIPKIVHYCWFGKIEKPDNVQRCIESWKKILIGYQFVEWNEDNFDYQAMEYTRQAYQEKKYAFVSDVARLAALVGYGGIYMDTDVEVLKSFDDLLNHTCIFGMEERNYIATSFIACESHFPLIQQLLDGYKNVTFSMESGSIETNVQKLTAIMEQYGFQKKNKFQSVAGVSIYPREYFSPYDYINCIDMKNENSYCIHYFYVSWQSNKVKVKKLIKKILGSCLGKKLMDQIRGYHE